MQCVKFKGDYYMGFVKRVLFNGIWYSCSEKGKYYFPEKVPNKDRKNLKQLHKAVYEFYSKKEIPKGYHIHHKDFNLDNNKYENLELLEASKHLSLHAKRNLQNPEYVKKNKEHLDKAREKSKIWHSSKEGKQWHKEHTKDSLKKVWDFREERICINCNRKYIAKGYYQKYCSQKCGRRYRTNAFKKKSL